MHFQTIICIIIIFDQLNVMFNCRKLIKKIKYNYSYQHQLYIKIVWYSLLLKYLMKFMFW